MHLFLIEWNSFEDWIVSQAPEEKKDDWDAIAEQLNLDSEPFMRMKVPVSKPELSRLVLKALKEKREFSVDENGGLLAASARSRTEITAYKVSGGQRFLSFRHSWKELNLSDGDVILVHYNTYYGRFVGSVRMSERPAVNFMHYIRQTNQVKIEQSVLAIVHYDSSNVAAAWDLRNGLADFNRKRQEEKVPLAVFSMETTNAEENHPVASRFPEKKRLLFDLMGYFNTAGSPPGALVLYASEPWLEKMEKILGPVRNFILLFYDHPTGNSRFFNSSSALVIPFEDSPMEILELVASVKIPDPEKVNKHLHSAMQKFRDADLVPDDGSLQDALYQQLLDKNLSWKMPAARAGFTLSDNLGKPRYCELEYQTELGKLLSRHNIPVRYAALKDLIGFKQPWFLK